MMSFHAAAAMVGAMLVMSTPALATSALAEVIVKDGSTTDFPRREVRFADLNLDTREGMDRLNSRIAAAVRNVCGPADNRMVREVRDMRSCRVQSAKQAFADRDAIIAARMAARGQPDKLAALGNSLRVGASAR